MKLMLKWVTCTTVLLNVSACSWLFDDDAIFRDRSNDYRKATVEQPLTIPAGIESHSIGDGYAIPAISDRTSLDDNFEIPRPDRLSDDVSRDAVRINKLNNQRWILVDGSPGQVWPRLRGFLNLNQLAVQRVDAVSGIIETTWLQPAGEGQLPERYQMRIDQGIQRDTSEVYVLHADSRAGKDAWPALSSNDQRAELMTKELAQYLADSTAAGAVSMLAQQAIDTTGKITLEENAQQQPFIRLNLPFTRAWASVHRSLEKSGYTIDDLNLSEKVYYVHYKDKAANKEKKGFFSRLFSWGSSDQDSADKGTPYIVRLANASDESIIITIESPDGETITKNRAERLLKLIKRTIA